MYKTDHTLTVISICYNSIYVHVIYMCFKWFVVHNQNQPIVLMNNKLDSSGHIVLTDFGLSKEFLPTDKVFISTYILNTVLDLRH
jgi:hypothetical protein